MSNYPAGVTDADPYFTDESEDTDVDPDGSVEQCVFCSSLRHDSSDCPDADQSVDEDLDW